MSIVSFNRYKVRSRPLHEEKRKFVPVDFANRGIDAINVGNVLHHKEVISVLLIGVVTVIVYILVQKLIRSPVHEKNTDTEDISKKFNPSSKPLFKSDDDSSDQVSSIEKQLYDIRRFLKLDEDLYTFVESTELDKLVLDNLISKCILMIEDREEIVNENTQNERNKVLLGILLERPYETFRLFKNVLKESDPHNSDVQDLLNKINWPKHIDKISCQNIIVFDHIVKLQKNYMAFVHDVDCRTDIVDRLYAADILNTEEKDEVCNISFSKQESNRTLIKKLSRRSGNACKLLFEALKDAKYYELAIQMEKTSISPQEIRLCQIGKKKFKERQEKRDWRAINDTLEEKVRSDVISRYIGEQFEKRLQESSASGMKPIKILSFKKVII